METSRREFIKAAAMSTVAGVVSGSDPLPVRGASSDGTEWVKSVCRFCGTGCGVMLGVRGGRPGDDGARRDALPADA